jgi:hypothetical protein
MATFCKPFPTATIRYFDHADAGQAQKWLGEAQPEGDSGRVVANTVPQWNLRHRRHETNERAEA